ncbi:helix-turn-helix domain-containing protein [Streptomyces qinglanensis]|uniref:helix-turn-helix domain-containing protein n=1 Tax=Streptomyces qinglanensis TaxID=943816 RepID=UPI003D74B95E
MRNRQNDGDDLRGSPVARKFGEDIKQVRLARKLTQKQLGNGTGYSEGYVSRAEAGIRLPSERFAAGCDKVFGTGSLFAEQLRRLLQGDRVPEWFVPYTDLEARADRILDYSPAFPIGILQTPEYAEAVFRTGPLAARGEDISPPLAARVARRKLLDKEDAPLLWVVITESCLRTPVGPASVMRGQLEHLAEMADHPRVTIQVLPHRAGATPSTVPFTLLRAESKWSAYCEFPHDGRTYEGDQVVAECIDLYDLIRARALSPEESVPYIQEISEVYQ